MTTLESSRQYIRDFDKLAESSKTAREIYDQMLKLHPDGSNPHILWLGALAVKGEGSPLLDLAVQAAGGHDVGKFITQTTILQ